VSVGNLAMGGRGKTPVAALVARLLVDAGEKPAILSRGYRRRRPDDGVVIVSDGTHILADLDRSGDEPLLLAHLAPGAAVLVHEQRAIAAALAERVLGATVHVLDDGFQHGSLRRDVDIVIVTRGDLGGRPLPFGRLRSPVSALARAGAVIVDEVGGDGDAGIRAMIPERVMVFTLSRRLGPAVPLQPERGWPAERPRVVAFAGIAEPNRFADALRASGWDVAGVVGFRDHHQYGSRDIERVAAAVQSSAAAGAVTTEKDAMRLLRLRPFPVPIASIPLEVEVVPAPEFRKWLLTRVGELVRC
jgi:tetraacyldisaccharide 4'-kinase